MNLKDPLFSRHDIFSTQNPATNITIDARNTSDLAGVAARVSNIDSLALANSTDALISAISGSGSHLWSFKAFWYIALPVTVATVLFPFMVPWLFRVTVAWLSKNRGWIIPVSQIPLIAAGVALSTEGYLIVFIFFFSIYIIFITLPSFYRASRDGKDQILWIGFANTLGISLWIDISRLRLLDGNAHNKPALYSILPPVYLMLSYSPIRETWLVRWTKIIIQRTFHYFVSKDGHIQSEARRGVLIIIYYATVTGYWYNVKDWGAILAIPFGIIIVNRLIWSVSHTLTRSFWCWILFLCLYIICTSVDRVLGSRGSRFGGFFIAYLPATLLFATWVYLDHQVYFNTFFTRSGRYHLSSSKTEN